MSQHYQNSEENDDIPDAERDAVISPWQDEQDALLPRILAMPAVTLAGFVARAKMALLWAPDLTEDAPEGWHVQMAGALVRDLIAIEGRAAT